MTYMRLRTVTIDLCNLRDQIFSRTEFAPSVGFYHTVAHIGWETALGDAALPLSLLL